MGERLVTSDGRTPPQLFLTFTCPKCGRKSEQDAYRGPVSCKDNHFPVFMEPNYIRPEIYHPPYVAKAIGRGGVPQ
jgi:hypothetical protein